MAPSPRRRTVAQWENLSAAYRKRLQGGGVTRSDYLAGESLRQARGHTRPTGAAPKAGTEAEIHGLSTPKIWAQLENWARSNVAPSWIPRNVSIDVQAALSQIDLSPKNWASVHFDPRPDGQAWTMTIVPKGNRPASYNRIVDIPGGGVGPGAREVLDWLWQDWSGIDLDVGGTL